MDPFFSIIVPCCDVVLRDFTFVDDIVDGIVRVVNKAVGYEPKTTIREGIPVFAKWYKEYHGL